MSAPVLHLYRVVETDPDALTIPTRPDVQCRPMPNRNFTYQVWHEVEGVVGYLRWCDDGSFRAWTLGTVHEAADRSKFESRERAVRWLEERYAEEEGRS